ncbi:MAG: globin [Actinomycetota bacterium]|nr:globin [Acidimicrobiia bacterium]MDQ3293266.1 globin [Actinomycetota bacterium]
MSEEPTLYAEVGGQEFFDALVDRFYDAIEADARIRPLYPADLEPGKRSLALFLGQYWGGPTTYSDTKGHPRLRMRHAPFAIGRRESEAWLDAMRGAVASADVDPTARQRLLDYFEMAATHMVNTPG